MEKTQNCVAGVERRGNTYYLRWRVPAEFRPVESRAEINQSLKTRDPEEARFRAELRKKAMKEEWRARLLQKDRGPDLETFHASVALLEEWGIAYKPIDSLLAGPLEDLVKRLNQIAVAPANSAVVPAALGTCDVPHVMISEMPELVEKQWHRKIKGKNRDQKRQWRNRYINASRTFVELVGDKPVHEITEHDAMLYHKHFQKLAEEGAISFDLAVKRLRYLRQIIEVFHEVACTLPSQIANPMAGFTIQTAASRKQSSNKGGKKTLPANWVKEFVNGRIAHGRGIDEAADIGVVVAETGCRQTEIFHIPPEDIRLDAPIPHLVLRYVEEGEHKRDLKNTASVREVPLLGAALEAMKRHPEGFPGYRGKGSFSNTINKHLRENGLFPEAPDGEEASYTFGGTRHCWEERAKAAKLENEERAFLLGHSVSKLRGRPIYGAGPNLKLRALYAELVAFPTAGWSPRPQKQVWKLIQKELDALGFRTS